MRFLPESGLSWIQPSSLLVMVTLFAAPPARAQDLALQINQYLAATIANKQSAVNVLVAKGDHLLIRSQFGQKEGKHLFFTNDGGDRFPIGTIAEQFVTTAVLRQEEQGRLKLDAPICSYLSDCPANWKEIDVVHLLTHTSGLPSLRQARLGQGEPAVSHLLGDLLAAADGQSLEFKPGSMFKYNPLDFLLLYVVIGSVTGEPPTRYIESAVLQPLSMTDTKYPASSQFFRQFLRSHMEDGSQTTEQPSPCEDNVCSTVDDLYRWERAVSTAKIVSHDSVRKMLTPYRDGHGLGWKILKEFNRKLALQGGRFEGISVTVRLYPDDDTSVILAANGSDIDSKELTHGIAAILFGRDYPSSPTATSAAVPPK